MISILERLDRGEILLADGAMGTLLLERGLKPGEPPESVNLARPQILEEIARLYLEAGAEIVQTNTFGASPLRLSEYGLDDRTEEINRVAARSVRAVVGDRAYISASCGPSARLLKPYGDTEPEDIYRSFERQITSLVLAGIDLICVETMTDLVEARLAIRAAKTVSPETPVMATMTFDSTPRGYFTVMGVGIPDAVLGLAEAGADIVGSNCGNGIERMVEIAAEIKKYASRPILIQANAGQPLAGEGRLVYPESPEFFAEQSRRLIDAGVSIIGGCCGTTPDHIRAIRRVLDD